jgi:hypothetical protein
MTKWCVELWKKQHCVVVSVLQYAQFINYKTSNKDVERKQTVRIEAEGHHADSMGF